MIVGARADAVFEQATMIGWSAERFARMKTVKSLGKYLAKPKRKANAESGAADVLAMAKRIKRKQDRKNSGPEVAER